MGVLMRRPDLVYRVDRALQESGLQRLSSADFDRSEYQQVFGLIQESLAQDVSEPLNFILNGLTLPLIEMADELLVRTNKLDTNEERILEDLMRALLALRQREVRQNLDHLRYLMEEAQQQGDRELSDYRTSVAQYTQVLNRLHQAAGRFSSRSASKPA